MFLKRSAGVSLRSARFDNKVGAEGRFAVGRDDVLRGQHAGAAERDSVQAEGADSEDGDAPNLRYARSAQAGHLETRLAPSAAVEWT